MRHRMKNWIWIIAKRHMKKKCHMPSAIHWALADIMQVCFWKNIRHKGEGNNVSTDNERNYGNHPTSSSVSSDWHDWRTGAGTSCSREKMCYLWWTLFCRTFSGRTGNAGCFNYRSTGTDRRGCNALSGWIQRKNRIFCRNQQCKI